jgi:hypothetical protein
LYSRIFIVFTYIYKIKIQDNLYKMTDIIRNPSGFITSDQIVILDTTNASSTNGSLYVEGGSSLHDIFVDGHVMINNVDVTPNLNDIVFERESNLSNNINTWTTIPDFEFDSSISRSFTSYIYVNVSAGIPKYAYREINGVFKSPGGWVISTYFSGDMTGVTFQITTESGIGKIQYKNINNSGTTTIRYRATTNAPPGSSPLGVASGIIENLTGPFTANKFVYANTNKTLASTDIEYTANQLVIGGTSRLLLENANSFQDFSAGGSLTSMGDGSIAQKLIVGQRIGIANTSPSYELDVMGDINFSGDLYQNGYMFSGGGGGTPSQWISGTGGNLSYTKGNVGIGTTAPTFKLDINGNLRVTTGITTANIFSTESTLTNVVSTNVTTASLNTTNSTITNLVSTTSSFGTIAGTTYTGGSMSLSGNLAIAGTLTTVNITTTNVVDTNISAGTLTATTISAGGLTVATSLITGAGGVGSNGSILITGQDSFGHSLYVASSASNKRLVFNNTGSVGNIFSYDYGGVGSQNLALQAFGSNVGIGTTSPQYTLDVNASNVYNAMRVNGASVLSNTNGTTINISPNNGSFGSIDTYTTGNFNVKLPLCLNPWGGSVGIGTISPPSEYKLDVNGTLHVGGINSVYSNYTNSTTGYLQLRAGWQSNSGYIEYYQSNGTRKGYIGYGGDTVAFQLVSEGDRNIEFATNTGTQMTITSIGNIGIGTGTPSVKLQVMNGGQSTARIYGNNNAIITDWPSGWGGGLNTFDISCASIYYNGLAQRSDIRKKDNVNPYTRGLSEVLQLRPVSFNWKEYNPTETQYGFIAQEVEAIIPEIVNEDSEGYKNIKDAYVPILVNAIKELQNQIDQMKRELGFR